MSHNVERKVGALKDGKHGSGNGSATSGRTAGSTATELYDLVGVGFGPSNLALAVAAREIDPLRTCLFVERNPRFSWHPGMLLDGSRMQISFLKDLVSMRNLASPYSFLSYVKARGRLEQFINLKEFHPSRLEYSDYLQWVAADFGGQVRYGTDVVGVSPLRSSLFEVRVRDVASGETRAIGARNVVVAPGGTPRLPPGVDPADVIHSSEFLPRFPTSFPDVSAPHRVVVVGDGQSAGEITMFILASYPNAEVHLLVSGYAPRPTDNSPFVNEQFYSQRSRHFHEQEPHRRARQLADLRHANYGVIEQELLDQIYRTAYADDVKGRRRLTVHPYARLTGAERGPGGMVATVEDRVDQTRQILRCDAVVLATGYQRRLDERVFADVLPSVDRDEAGDPILSDSYRVRLRPPLTAGLYVQGLGERSFGLGDTLLSMLPFRSKQIVDDIATRSAPAAEPLYPLAHYLEHDQEKLHAVIERFKFATLISARGVDDPVVTQIPLILNRSAGRKGVLFGHLDRSNPHAGLLDDRPVVILFHGPNGYISPHVYESDQLPTWNSITVRVRGQARMIRDRERVIEGLCAIAAKSEQFPYLSTLEPDDPRIDQLINYIVAFEFEIIDITGRFKLSQDRQDEDRRRAAVALADTAESSHRDLIGFLLDMSVEEAATARPS